MTRSQILLAKSLEAAGVRLSVETFDERLILQKAVYLLQSAGIHMGYRFRWYLKGPYSPDMTADAFALTGAGETGTSELGRWKLDEASAVVAQRLEELLCRAGEDTPTQAKRLELSASLLFLLNTKQATPTDANGAAAILQRNGKQFSASEVRTAITELRSYGFLPA